MTTRTLAALVPAVLVALALVPPAHADEAAALRAEFGAAYLAQDWPSALRTGERLLALDPADAAMHYNLACALALSGDAEGALAELIRAGETGFSLITTFRTDPDLSSVRALPGHARALALVLANHERDLAAFRERAALTQPLLFAPSGLRGPAPLLIALHGRGGRAREMFEAWKPLAERAGMALVAPQSLDPFGEGFHWLKVDEAEHLVLLAIEQAAKEHEIDRQRIVVTGFSQGGYLAFVMGARHPETFLGVIPVGSYTDAAVEVPEADGRLPRYEVLVGGRDEVLEGCRASVATLTGAGLDARLRVIEGLGHDLPPARDLRRALRRVLK